MKGTSDGFEGAALGDGIPSQESVLDVVLLVLAVGIAIAFAFIEPSTARAAGLDQGR